MNGLDSPLETLTFIPVNLGTLISAVANNFWAWLAVITATLSFWRLRTTKTTSPLISLPLPQTPPPPTTTTTKTTSFKCLDIAETMQEEEEEQGVLTRGNSKKFFSVYFEERESMNQLEEEEEEEYDDEMDGEDEMENETRVVMIKRSSELTVEMRGGWYSYQNRKVINGSVVRLWDENRENGFCSSPRSCRSRHTTRQMIW